jgi:hypothetical protein
VIATEVRLAAVTVSVAVLLMPPEVAVIDAVPLVALVASPLLATVATEVAEEVQLAVVVRFWVVPLE